MQVAGIINSVQPRAAGNTTIYDIDIGGQVYSTFDAGQMRVANDHIGQLVTAEVDVKPSKDGRFTNYNFLGIPGAAPVTPQLGPTQPQQTPPQPVIHHQGPPAPTAAETDARITRLSLIQSASRLVGHIYEGAGPESLIEAQDAATVLAKAWYKLVMGPSPAPLQAVPEPEQQPVQETAQNELPDW